MSEHGGSVLTIKSVVLTIDQDQYEFIQGNAVWGGSQGPWYANYYYEGSIPISAPENAMIQYENMGIGPFNLTQAMTAANLFDLGPSDKQNGFRITGIVTQLDGSKRKLNLITQLPEGQIVDSYGKQPISENLQLQMLDGRGNPMDILKDANFLKPSDLLFEASTEESDHYQLTIPSIRIVDRSIPHLKVTIPVPDKGSMDLNVTINLSGLPLDFTRVERLDEKSIRIEVDVHYDPSKPKSLQSYRIFDNNGTFMSSTTGMNEKSKAFETEWLDIMPGQKEISFYIGEPQIVYKGPWILRNLQ